MNRKIVFVYCNNFLLPWKTTQFQIFNHGISIKSMSTYFISYRRFHYTSSVRTYYADVFLYNLDIIVIRLSIVCVCYCIMIHVCNLKKGKFFSCIIKRYQQINIWKTCLLLFCCMQAFYWVSLRALYSGKL
jgi:hypothetical protein